MIKHTITTLDNPFDPFDSPDEWESWDQAAGYNTTSYLARLLPYSPELDEGDTYDRLYNDIVLEAVRLNITGNYILVESPKK